MSDRKPKVRVQVTTDHSLFTRSTDNRPLDLAAHKKLRQSMEQYGFLSVFPIICYRDSHGSLVIKDGQHRHRFAAELGLPVYWIETDAQFDVAMINTTARIWKPDDFAKMHALNGKKPYADAIEFATAHGLPVARAFALLAGTTSFGNIQEAFTAGTYEITDRPWADAVVGVFTAMTARAPVMKRDTFLQACMMVCRVSEFQRNRLVANADRCREKLCGYSTKAGYLDMLETVYNFGQKKLVPLKTLAETAMRDRAPIGKPRDGRTKAS